MSDGSERETTDEREVAQLFGRNHGSTVGAFKISGDEPLKAVFPLLLLLVNRTVTTLCISGNKFGVEGANDLANVLAMNSTIKHLMFGDGMSGDEGGKALAHALANNSTITHLMFGGDMMGDEGAKALAHALANNSTLTHLMVLCEKIGDEGAKALADTLANNSTLKHLVFGGSKIGDEGAKALADALANNSTLTHLMLGGSEMGDEGAKAWADALTINSTITHLMFGGDVIGDEGAKALADALANNSTLTHLLMHYENNGDEGAKALADALANNSTLTHMLVDGKIIGDEGAKALADALANNSTLTHMLVDGKKLSDKGVKALADALANSSTLATLGMDRSSIDLLIREVMVAPFMGSLMVKKFLTPQQRRNGIKKDPISSPPRSLPLSLPSFADLRRRYSSRDFGMLSLDTRKERVLVTAASARDPLRRSAATLDCVTTDWRMVVEAQRTIAVGKGEDEHAIRVRDSAVSSFIESSTALEETRKSLSSLTLTAPPPTKDGESADLLSAAEMDDILEKVSKWISRIDGVVTSRMATVARVRDSFVEAHKKLGIAIGSDSTHAMKEAEELCLERAIAVEKVVAQDPVTRRSPLSKMPANLDARVIASLASQRSCILDEIATLEEHRKELLSHGDTCPSVDELNGMRKRLKKASRSVEQAEMDHRHAVEDGEDTAELAAALDKARADQCVAARAADAERLRLSLASTRWPELRFRLDDDVAGARNIAVFADQSILAKGPPTTRFKVLKGTAPDGTRVALKLFPLGDGASGKATTRFMREAEKLRRLRFDHVVDVRDVFVHVEGKQRIGVLELQYYGRGDMQQWLDQGEPRPSPVQIRSVLRDALLGLSFCHGVGIVHADVKPANIFIADDGTAVLGDFDVSHDDGVRLTTTALVGATLAFMAPELRVVGARASKASDVFAFGKTIEHVRDRLQEDVSSFLSRCTAAKPGDRCTAEQALADVFFRGAACRPDEWTSADCKIMAHCGGEAQHAGSGVHCTSGHFVCTADLEALIVSRAETADEVQCPDQSCGTRRYDAALLAAAISKGAFAAWMRGKERRIEAALAAGLEAQLKQQLEAKLAEYSAVDGDVKRHTDAIVERFVNISCPRCRAVFIDFTGCTALTCGVTRCKAAFCAWCLTDCGDDAHQHVPRCPENASRADEHADPFFTSFDRWQTAMADRTRRLVKQYLEEDIHDTKVRKKVVERLQTLTSETYG
jgi:Ran GTPase-activating protein (RanGAP) involved in mRNA processing and transport